MAARLATGDIRFNGSLQRSLFNMPLTHSQECRGFGGQSLQELRNGREPGRILNINYSERGDISTAWPSDGCRGADVKPVSYLFVGVGTGIAIQSGSEH